MTSQFRKKHYEAIAQVLRNMAKDSADGWRAARKVKQELGTMFVADNPNFDRGRFEEACEP